MGLGGCMDTAKYSFTQELKISIIGKYGTFIAQMRGIAQQADKLYKQQIGDVSRANKTQFAACLNALNSFLHKKGQPSLMDFNNLLSDVVDKGYNVVRNLKIRATNALAIGELTEIQSQNIIKDNTHAYGELVQSTIKQQSDIVTTLMPKPLPLFVDTSMWILITRLLGIEQLQEATLTQLNRYQTNRASLLREDIYLTKDAKVTFLQELNKKHGKYAGN